LLNRLDPGSRVGLDWKVFIACGGGKRLYPFKVEVVQIGGLGGAWCG
jgi:hypothetical protein